MPVVTYTVQQGDNLSNIAARFNTTVQDLQQANNIQNADLIYIGQVLIIPSSVPTSNLTIRTIDHGVRLRSSPAFADNNFLLLLAKDTVFSNASLQGDWWKVQYQGQDAYIHASMVETFAPNPNPVVPANTIVYRSQWDIDANNRSADCGQTCVAMLAASRGVNVRINDLPYQTSALGYTNAGSLVSNFGHLNLAAHVTGVAVGIQAPSNSICLMWYGGLRRNSVQDKNFAGWHWVVFLREEGNKVVVHDPDFWGGRRHEGSEKRYSKTEWNAAFIPYGSNSTRTCVELA